MRSHGVPGVQKAPLTFVDMLRRGGGRGVEEGEEEEREERPCSPLGHHFFNKKSLQASGEPRRISLGCKSSAACLLLLLLYTLYTPPRQDEKFKLVRAPRKCKETSGTSYF